MNIKNGESSEKRKALRAVESTSWKLKPSFELSPSPAGFVPIIKVSFLHSQSNMSNAGYSSSSERKVHSQGYTMQMVILFLPTSSQIMCKFNEAAVYLFKCHKQDEV